MFSSEGPVIVPAAGGGGSRGDRSRQVDVNEVCCPDSHYALCQLASHGENRIVRKLPGIVLVQEGIIIS